MKSQIKEGDYPEYYQKYIELLPNEDLVGIMKTYRQNFLDFLKGLHPEDLQKSYAERKWTVGEVLQHMFDTERIFQYRALSLARKDLTPLPGYDQDAYVPASRAHRRSLPDLIEDFLAVRNSSITLFNSLDEEMLNSKGISNEKPLTPLAAGFIICGHQKHHQILFESKYGL